MATRRQGYQPQRENIEGLASALTLRQPDIAGSITTGLDTGLSVRAAALKRKLEEAGIMPAAGVKPLAQEIGLDLGQQENIGLPQAISIAEQARLARQSRLPKPVDENREAQLELQRQRLNLAQERLGFEREKTAGQPERQAAAAAKKAFNEQRTAIGSLDKSLDLLTNAANAMGGFEPGVISQGIGKAVTGVKGFAADPTVRNFQQSVDTTLAEIARGPLKQKGVLTDRDIDLARSVISKPEEPINNKLAAIERLRFQSYSNLGASAQTAGDTAGAAQYNTLAEQSMSKMNRLLGINQSEGNGAVIKLERGPDGKLRRAQ